MDVTMTNKEIYELYTCLSRNRQMRYSSITYTAFKNYSAIRAQGEVITDMIQSLLAEHADHAEGNEYKFKDAKHREVYFKKYNELMDTVEDVTLYKIPREDFDSEVEHLIAEDKVSLGDCDILERYIVERVNDHG